MACLYPKKNSPFWYVKFTDKDGVMRNKSTGLRRDSEHETEKAGLMRAELEVSERRMNSVRTAGDTGWAFALPHLKQHANKKNRTFPAYHARWKHVNHWLALSRLTSPEQIIHKHVEEYLKWRVGQVKRSGKRVSWNTAMMDLIPWGLVMQKAVWLGLIRANPLYRHGFKKEEVEELKPEITDAEFAVIIPALRKEAKKDPKKQWMLDSFLIGMETGCRLRETVIPLNGIDLKNKSMTFPRPKGGPKKAFSIPIPDALLPLFTRMKKDGRMVTLEMPFQPSRQWSLFFQRVKMPHLCFHCLRVTKVTRLRRAGVPREAAMRLVNHSSELIHLLYDRHQVEDLRQWANAGSPSAAFAK